MSEKHKKLLMAVAVVVGTMAVVRFVKTVNVPVVSGVAQKFL